MLPLCIYVRHSWKQLFIQHNESKALVSLNLNSPLVYAVNYIIKGTITFKTSYYWEFHLNIVYIINNTKALIPLIHVTYKNNTFPGEFYAPRNGEKSDVEMRNILLGVARKFVIFSYLRHQS